MHPVEPKTTRPLWIGVAVILVMLHLFTLWFVFTFTTTYPLSIDEWIRYVPRHDALLDGTLTTRQIIDAQSSVAEGPPVFLFVSWGLTLPNVLLFDWNLRVDSFVNYLTVTVNAVLVMILLTRRHPHLRLALAIPVTALALAVQQRWNLIVSVHHNLLLQLTFVLLVIILISQPSRNWKTALLGAGVAFVGTFIAMPGFLTWFPYLLGLVLLRFRGWQPYAIGILCAALAAAVFFSMPGLTLEDSNYLVETETGLLEDLVGYVFFSVTLLGAVFNAGRESNIAISMLMGLLGWVTLAWNAVVVWRRGDERESTLLAVCLTLAAYGGVYSLLVGVGRLGVFGMRQALATPYMTLSSTFWYAAVGLVALNLHTILVDKRGKPPLALFNLLVMGVGTVYFVAGAYGTVRVAQAHTATVIEAERCIVETATRQRPGDEGCLVVGGIAEVEWIDTLYRHRLTGFAADLNPPQQ